MIATGRRAQGQPAAVPPAANSSSATIVGGSGIGILPWLYLQGSLLRSSGITPEQSQAALAQYYTNGAEAATVPSSGPGSEYFTQGAEVTAALPSVMPEPGFGIGATAVPSEQPIAPPPAPPGQAQMAPPWTLPQTQSGAPAPGAAAPPNAETTAGGLESQNAIAPAPPPESGGSPPSETSSETPPGAAGSETPGAAGNETPPGAAGGETPAGGSAASPASQSAANAPPQQESEPGGTGTSAAPGVQPGAGPAAPPRVDRPSANRSPDEGAPETMPSSTGLTNGTAVPSAASTGESRAPVPTGASPASSCSQSVLTLLGGMLVGALVVITGAWLGRHWSTPVRARGG